MDQPLQELFIDYSQHQGAIHFDAMEEAVLEIKKSEPQLQRKWLIKLRKSLLENLPDLLMKEERKSYIYHQIAHIHDLDELNFFIHEINSLQLSEPDSIIELIFLTNSAEGVIWAKQSCKSFASPLT